MLTMEDMESTLDPRHPVSPPSHMLDSPFRDMPPDMAMDLDTMERGLLMLMHTMVLMASAMLDMVMDMPDMEDTMAPMLLLLLLVVLPSEDMDSTLDPRPLVSPPSPMLDSLCKDMPRDMAMDSMAITKTPFLQPELAATV